jgi:hypothetical protein
MSKPSKLHFFNYDIFTVCGRKIDKEIKATSIEEKFQTGDNKCGTCNRALKARGIIK